MIIDTNTGMPELPEGYFFRVHKSYAGSKYHYVTIFRKETKRFLFWTYTKDREQIFNDMVHPTLTKENVLQSAIKCVRLRDNWLTNNTDLLGDYPPKKLGA